MSLLSVALAYYLRQRSLTRAAQAAARLIWRDVRPADLDRSWAQVSERMTVTVASAQLLAAEQAQPYVADALDEQGVDDDRRGEVRPRSLAGVSSDGRPLAGLLYSPVVEVKRALAVPARPVPEAMARGEAALVQIVGTQVQDAGRVAAAVAIAATPAVKAWVRVLRPPSCGRCTILAGRVYRWSDGFARHPLCDCVHLALTSGAKNDLTTNPRAYFDSLPRAEQNRLFGTSRTQRILDGEDMNRVINSGRSTATAGGRRRAAGRSRTARSARARRMPEEVIQDAASRDEAILDLDRAGFLD